METILTIFSYALISYIFFFSGLLKEYHIIKTNSTKAQIVARYLFIFCIPVIFYIIKDVPLYLLINGIFIHMFSAIISISFFIFLIENTLLDKRVSEIYRFSLHIAFTATQDYTPIVLLIKLMT